MKDDRRSAIRKATPSDSAGILECLSAAFEAYRTSYTPEAFTDTVLTPDTLQRRLATMRLFVAVSESGEVVGTIGCHVVHYVVHPVVQPVAHPVVQPVVQPKEGHIRGMAVLPTWQGSGVAAQLLQSAESELRDQGCSCITLNTTQPLQTAMRFYEKNGFRRSGKIKDFFGMTLFEYVKALAD
jgi:ribosomal protein S18 acetylase RimI-like enzyme